MFALIEGLSFGEIATRVLHKVGLGLPAAKAVGPASELRVDGAIRLYVFVIGKTPGTHVAELASRCIICGGLRTGCPCFPESLQGNSDSPFKVKPQVLMTTGALSKALLDLAGGPNRGLALWR